MVELKDDTFAVSSVNCQYQYIVDSCKWWYTDCFSTPPINPRLVYVYLIACIGCGVLLSGGFKQKAACLVYAGQMLYFAVNFYTNPKWDYPQWQRVRTHFTPTPKWDYPQVEARVRTRFTPTPNGTTHKGIVAEGKDLPYLSYTNPNIGLPSVAQGKDLLYTNPKMGLPALA